MVPQAGEIELPMRPMDPVPTLEERTSGLPAVPGIRPRFPPIVRSITRRRAVVFHRRADATGARDGSGHGEDLDPPGHSRPRPERATHRCLPRWPIHAGHRWHPAGEDALQRRRRVFMTPGEEYEIEVDLWSTAMVFNAGHRIRVAIAGTNWNRFEVNPNDGGDLNDPHPIAAYPEILFGPDHPTSIELPIPFVLPFFDGFESGDTSAWSATVP